MSRVVHKEGFIQGLPDIIEKIMEAKASDIEQLMQLLYSTPGVLMKIVNGEFTDDLAVQYENIPERLKIMPGGAITPDWHCVIVEETKYIELTRPAVSKIYWVKIKYKEYPTESVPYDKDYSDDGYSYWVSGYEIVFDENPPQSSNEIGIAKVIYNADLLEWDVIDQRVPAVMRSVDIGEVPAPTTPQGLTLTTGAMADLPKSYNYEDVFNVTYGAWIKASWQQPSQGGPVLYYMVRCVPKKQNDEEVISDTITRVIFNIGGQTGLQHCLFTNLIPVVKYKVYVQAIGYPPKYKASDVVTGEIIAGRQLGAPQNLQCSDVYSQPFREAASSGYPKIYQGIKVTWDPPQGFENEILTYEVFARMGSEAQLDPPNCYNYKVAWGTQREVVIPAANGEVWKIKVRAIDQTGRAGEFAEIIHEFGDVEPPEVPQNLRLTTGIEGGYTIDTTQVTLNPLAWIRADWDASNDNKSGIAFYEAVIVRVIDNQPNVGTIETTQQFWMPPGQTAPATYVVWRGLPLGVRYAVRVRAVDKCGNASGWSDWVEITAGRPSVSPVPPVVNVENIKGGVKITWSYDGPASAFEIYGKLGEPPSIPNDLIAVMPGESREFIHIPAIDSTSNRWYYKVRTIYQGEASGATERSIQVGVVSQDDFNAVKNEILRARVNEDGVEFVDLKTRLDVGINKFGTEIIEARGGYSNLNERISAIVRGGGIDWRNVRIVAKEGGQFSSIQKAVESIGNYEDGTILIMPGVYYEESGTIKIVNRNVVLVGVGRVVIKGTQILGNVDSGTCLKLQNLSLIATRADNYPLVRLGHTGSVDKGAVFQNVDIVAAAVPQNNIGNLIEITSRSLVGMFYNAIVFDNVRMNYTAEVGGYINGVSVYSNEGHIMTFGVVIKNSAVRLTGNLFDFTELELTGEKGRQINVVNSVLISDEPFNYVVKINEDVGSNHMVLFSSSVLHGRLPGDTNKYKLYNCRILDQNSGDVLPDINVYEVDF